MKKVGLVYHPIYLKHDTGGFHPERKSRLEAILRQLKKDNIYSNMVLTEPKEASVEWISEIHDVSYINRVKLASSEGVSYLDTQDCPVNKMTYEAALLAAGAGLSAVDQIIQGEIDRAFCAVRPPGHHAERNYAMGFCFFNNIAITARYIQKKYKLNKIFILDWDVHHGNGTQHAFENDSNVFFASLHQDPRTCYPGTGYSEETGKGNGMGYTLNCPIPPNIDEEIYLETFMNKVIPAIIDFKPDFFLISAGFDAHIDDPLANLSLTEETFAKMTSHIVDLSNEYSNGRIVSILEGGYNLIALGNSVSAHIKVLMK
ncbi:MAG: histone deacetylase [Spirochaetota bacterium]|nr:histone deacetylase [Spirochaetota bacterium]